MVGWGGNKAEGARLQMITMLMLVQECLLYDELMRLTMK